MEQVGFLNTQAVASGSRCVPSAGLAGVRYLEDSHRNLASQDERILAGAKPNRLHAMQAVKRHFAVEHAIYCLSLLGVLLVLQGCASSKPKKPQTADEARAYFEELRAEYNAGKVRSLNKVMKLNAAEADKFWPIYRNYEQELAPVSDRKLALLREYLTYRKEGTLTEERCREFTAQWLENAQARLDLWKKYNEQISARVSPLRGAQFLQVENQMALYVDSSVASDMPIVGSSPEAKR